MDLDLNVEMPSAQAAPAAQPPASPSPSVQPAAKIKVMVPAVKRLDTMEKKRRLDAELGPNQADYWAAVLQFLSAKISRYEFYEVVVSMLGIENMRLHNDFFLAILYNANSTELPPSKKQLAASSLSPSISPMEETPLVAVKASPSPILTADLAPLTPSPSIPALAVNASSHPSNAAQVKAAKPSKKKKPEPVLNPFTQRLAVSQFDQSQSQPNASLVDLPHIPMQHVGVPGMHRDYLKGADSLTSNDIVHVRDTLQRRAREAGIKAVSEDAVSAVNFGLEQHLRKILNQAVKFAASDRARRQRLGDLDERQNRNKKSFIGVQNLLTAIVNNPNLVGDELPLIRERIMRDYIV